MGEQTNNTNDENEGRADGTVTQLRPQVIEGEYTVAPQGTAAAPAKKMPRRIVEIALPEPYQDFSITAWLNFPRSVKDDFNSNVEGRVRAALMQIVVGHDLVDYDGRPYPPADDPAFWTEIPNDTGLVIVAAVGNQIGKLTPTNAARS